MRDESANRRTSTRAPGHRLALALWWAAIIIGLLAVAGTATADTLTCTDTERATANKALKLSDAARSQSIAQNVPWGVPVSDGATNEQLLVQKDYVIDYDTDLRSPMWVAYQLDSKRLGKSPRINCFRADPRLSTQLRSDPSDYNEPIFDQGHMAPNGDMTSSKSSVVNSFVMSNMVPQYCQLNRGVWQILESLVRHWADEGDVLYVMSGSIFDRDGDGARDSDDMAKHMKSKNGKERVAVPSAFYKIIVRERSDGRLESISIILPHDQTDLDGDKAIRYLGEHVSSVKAIQKLTGLAIFPGASPAPIEDAKLWPTGDFVAESLVFAPCRKTAGADDE